MRAVDRVITAMAAQQTVGGSWLVGDPCVPPPPVLSEAFSRAAKSDRFPYPPAAGRPGLRGVLADFHREGGVVAGADQIVVTSGAKSGLFALLAEVLEPGDEIIHPRPCYPAYPAMAARLGARAVAVDEPGGSFSGWARAVANRFGPKTRAVVLSSPSNPTGATLGNDQARQLVDCCREAGVRLICDEAYGEFRFGEGCDLLPAEFDPRRETVIQVRSTSKTWAVCGWRIGWIVSDPVLALRVAERHLSLFGPASGPAQTALEALPDVDEDFIRESRATVIGRLHQVTDVLAGRGLSLEQPNGGFYLWIALGNLLRKSEFASAASWCEDLARRTGVGLWPGEDFHGPGHVRIAVTAPHPDDWAAAVAALESAFNRL